MIRCSLPFSVILAFVLDSHREQRASVFYLEARLRLIFYCDPRWFGGLNVRSLGRDRAGRSPPQYGGPWVAAAFQGVRASILCHGSQEFREALFEKGVIPEKDFAAAQLRGPQPRVERNRQVINPHLVLI